ncbi:MAG: CBS domain-containing protein [Candidatus Lokiarchaeota archaeon]|nr:CBS domain-containing protein [Candidatus Lokiarchaeota archaeon]
MTKTYEEINEKIRDGNAVVVTAEEMIEIVGNNGVEVAAEEVDVVTTGTFGAMCSSGAFLNFGHSDPPCKPEHVWLNGVHAYHGNAAVDIYIGVTRMSDKRPFKYGGGHVIEDLLIGKPIKLRGTSYTTDCYPLEEIDTVFTLDDLNQAILCNPRNGYQRYNCATNSTNRTIYTYMGKLLPNYGNATYSGAGELNPIQNDPDFETIGIGTKIFLGGGIGYVIGEGTQHDPKNAFGSLFVKGNLKNMNAEYLRGVNFEKYGTTMYVGLGIPIPILNAGLAKKCAIKDEDIITEVKDYGVPRREKPVLTKVSYKELKSGRIEVNEKSIRCSSLSSLYMARKIANKLKDWIKKGDFQLTKPVGKIPLDTKFKPMKMTKEIKFVRSVSRDAFTCTLNDNIKYVANLILKESTNHLPVVDNSGRLVGIVTSFDITEGLALDKTRLKDIYTKKVIYTECDEPIDVAARKMRANKISALPVVDKDHKVIGIVSAEDLI